MFILLNKGTVEDHTCRIILKLVTAGSIETIFFFRTHVKHECPAKQPVLPSAPDRGAPRDQAGRRAGCWLPQPRAATSWRGGPDPASLPPVRPA